MDRQWKKARGFTPCSAFGILCSELPGCTCQENSSTAVPQLDSRAALHLFSGLTSGNPPWRSLCCPLSVSTSALEGRYGCSKVSKHVGKARNSTSKCRLYPSSWCTGVYRHKLCLLWKLGPVSPHRAKPWFFKGMWESALTDNHLRRGGPS